MKPLTAGVSTACLYPRETEEALYDLAVGGVSCAEVFINSESELRRGFVDELRRTLEHFEMTCPAVHPYDCPMDPLNLFSPYRRRAEDFLESRKVYFEAMNRLGARIFVFHGAKLPRSSDAFYFERYEKLVRLGKEFGITVAQENVEYCSSGTLSFLTAMKRALGEDAAFVLDVKQAVRAKQNPLDLVTALGDRIVHVHISDHGELGDCLLLGKGRFPVRQFLTSLLKSGSKASVMLELYRSNFSAAWDLIQNYQVLCRQTERVLTQHSAAQQQKGEHHAMSVL